MVTVLAETFRMAPPGGLAVTAAVCVVGVLVVIAFPFLIPFVRTFRRQPRDAPLEDRLAASDWGLGLTGGLLWLIGAALALAFAYDFNVAIGLRAGAMHIEGGLFAPRYQGASTEGYVLLLDLQAPHRFVQALQRRHAHPPACSTSSCSTSS